MPITAQQTITVRRTRAQVYRELARLPSLMSGKAGAGGLVRVMQVRLGLAALQLINHAFRVKAEGGTDATGLRWKPLSAYTIRARQRKGIVGHAAPKKVHDERKRWWDVYKAARQGGHTEAASSILAWHQAKREGATTFDPRKGGALDKILIETGALELSLKAGAPPSAAAFTPPRQPLQVFRLGKGEVTIGTRRKWALAQHEGRPNRRSPLPQRRLWPAIPSWPSLWWQYLLRQLQESAIEIAIHLLRR